MRADLHIHSTCSDGTETPENILRMVKEKEFFGLSITDHDTSAAYTPEFFKLADKLKLKVLVGAELSSTLDDHNVHILAYDFDHEDPSFCKFIESIQKSRYKRNVKILENLKKLGIFIDPTLLEKSVVIGRPHIAQALIEKGIVNNIKEAFEIYLKEGAKAYYPGLRPHSQKVIEEIHKAKGKAFIAHPHLTPKRILEKLLHLPFNGIECYYARFPRDKEKAYLDIAKKKRWLISGGSDFHGHIKPLNALGASWVDEETFNKILL